MTGSGDTNRDVVERAKAALEGIVTPGEWAAPATLLGSRCGTVFAGNTPIAYLNAGDDNRGDAEFMAASRQLVPELVAELEQVRQWHSNQADKLERVLALARKWDDSGGQFGKIYARGLFQSLAIHRTDGLGEQ